MDEAAAAAAVAQPRARDDEPEPCPDCGGRCGDPDAGEWRRDCDGYEARIEAMYEAHPADEPWPQDFEGNAKRAVETEQLAAFEARAERWWLVVPSGPARS